MSAPCKKLRLQSQESQILPALRLAMVTYGRIGDLYRLIQLSRSWCSSIRTEAEWWQAVHWDGTKACQDAVPAWLHAREKGLVPSMTLHLQDVMRSCSLSRWRAVCGTELARLQHLTLHSMRQKLSLRIQGMAGALDQLPLISYCGPMALCPVGPTLQRIQLIRIETNLQRWPLHELLAQCPQLLELHHLCLPLASTYALAHPLLQTLKIRMQCPGDSTLLSLRGLVKLQRLHLRGNVSAFRLSPTLQHLFLPTLPSRVPPQLKTLVVYQTPPCLTLGNLPKLQNLQLRGNHCEQLCLTNLPQLEHLACFYAQVKLQATATLKTLLLPYTESVEVTGSLAGVKTLDCPVALNCPQATDVTLYHDATATGYPTVQHVMHVSRSDTWLQLTAPEVTLDGMHCMHRSLAVQGRSVAVLRVQHYRFLRSLLAQPGTLLQLREVHLRSCNCLDVSSLNTDFLGACPHLQELSIWGAVYSVHQNLCVQSPSLRTLSFDWDTSAIHIRTLDLLCPQLTALTLRAGGRGHSHLLSTWNVPATLTHLRMRYDLHGEELVNLMRQLPALVHLTWQGCKLPLVVLDLPCLQRLEYEISQPNLELDLRLCPQLSTLHLTATTNCELQELFLPPTTSTVCLGHKCRIAKGVPNHALRFDLSWD